MRPLHSMTGICLGILVLGSPSWAWAQSVAVPGPGVSAGMNTVSTGSAPPGALAQDAPAQGATPGTQATAMPAPGTSAPLDRSPTARTDPQGKKGISPYTVRLVQGSAAHAAHDDKGAVAAFKAAIASDANAPFGYYLLGETHLAAGRVDEAEEAFRTGLSKAEGADHVKAKLLFVLADLRERQGKLDEAKKLWTEYAQFVAMHPRVGGHPHSSAERLKRIDSHIELAQQGALVRQRIEDRAKLKGTPSETPDNKR